MRIWKRECSTNGELQDPGEIESTYLYSWHVRNVFKEGELVKESVWAKFAYTATEGKEYDKYQLKQEVMISPVEKHFLESLDKLDEIAGQK